MRRSPFHRPLRLKIHIKQEKVSTFVLAKMLLYNIIHIGQLPVLTCKTHFMVYTHTQPETVSRYFSSGITLLN